MKNRNPIAVFVLPFVTLGIYGIVWFVKTKNEMNSLGAEIPTAWLLIIPFVNIYWLYKYSAGIDKVTGGKMSTLLAFILLLILGPIGSAIAQTEFNKVSSAPAVAAPATSGQMETVAPIEAVPASAVPMEAVSPVAAVPAAVETVAPMEAVPVGTQTTTITAQTVESTQITPPTDTPAPTV